MAPAGDRRRIQRRREMSNGSHSAGVLEMARIFITGSADGLGQLAAKALIAQGHRVVLHARNEKRGQDAFDKVPGAERVVAADLGSIDETRQLASKVNALGKFDAVISLCHEITGVSFP